MQMKLSQIPIPLNEMAAKKICPICNNPMAGFHYWYKGGWKCKKSSINPPAPGAATTIPGAPPTAPLAKPKMPSKQTAPKVTLEDWLAKHNIKNYTINNDGSLDVKGAVFLDDFRGPHLPIKFNDVSDDFSCSGGMLTTLENCPTTVGGSFWVNHNQLTSLEGFPTHVGGSVSISGNDKLASLDGINGLIVGSNFFGEGLTSLTSLKGISKQIKSMGGKLNINGSIKTNVLGTMMIRDIKEVSTGNSKADHIMNTHLKGDRDPLTAQDEMIDAGCGNLAGP
jgi:hypothetical protein